MSDTEHARPQIDTDSPGPPDTSSTVVNPPLDAPKDSRARHASPNPPVNPTLQGPLMDPREESPDIVYLFSGRARTISPDMTVVVPRPPTRVVTPGRPVINATTNVPAVAAVFAPNHRRMAPAAAPPPPTPAQDSIGLEAYFLMAQIREEDLDTCEHIVKHKITHWTYFRLSTEQELCQLGFAAGPARLLCLAVPRALAWTGVRDDA
ncbi:hypothetical protein PCANC_03426 [Puccinia coronata f. sp. avenae]|uniref:Uncharacterized protein n=1 Tax=Puccinia coronata f. sp. avenae TaxID=200324 RepID=A0A2N5W2B8_9BASI|nr:hypothetical protein PCANC_03426 [Puccinia coronata f. sp. avenae]